jgi:branched-chain amino acid transport system substrate-binding protein
VRSSKNGGVTRWRRAAITLVAVTMLAACGTRLPDSAFEQHATQTQRTKTTTDDGFLGTTDGDTTETTLADDATASADGAPRGNTPTHSGPVARADEGPNKASDVGVTESTVTIGNITAENGVLGDAFAPSARGLRAWAAATNARGGIRGRKVVLKTCDDREDRNRDLACAQQLVEQDKVFAIVATNTRALGGAAQYLADRNVPVLGMPITNSFYRYPTFFSSYRTNVHRDSKPVTQIVTTSGYFRWFKQNLNVTKAAVFSYDIDASQQAGDLFKKGLELEGFQVTQYVVAFAAPSFDQPVADMQSKGTQIIFDSMDDGANRKLCDAMGRRQFSVKAKVGTVVSLGDRAKEFNDTCRRAAYTVGFTRNYNETSIPEIARFRDAYRKYQPNLPVHQWALEAWFLGNLTASYLNSAAPTRKGFVSYLNNVRDYTGDGIHAGLDWEKFDASAPRVRDCFAVAHWVDSAGGWTNASSSFPACYPDAFQYQSRALEQGN